MAQIHILPTTKLGSLQLQRLEGKLERNFAAGVELGSRTPHIHAIGSALQELCDALQDWTDTLPAANSVPEVDAARATCGRLVEEVRCLAGLAQRYPACRLAGADELAH